MAQQVQGEISTPRRSRQHPVRLDADLLGHGGRGQPYSPHGAYSGNSQAFTIKRRQRGAGRRLGPGRPALRRRHIGGSERLHDAAEHRHPPPSKARRQPLRRACRADMTALSANMTQAESAATTLGESTQQVTAASTAASEHLDAAPKDPLHDRVDRRPHRHSRSAVGPHDLPGRALRCFADRTRDAGSVPQVVTSQGLRKEAPHASRNRAACPARFGADLPRRPPRLQGRPPLSPRASR